MSHNRRRIPSRIKKITKNFPEKLANHKDVKRHSSRKTARKRLFKSKTNLKIFWKFNHLNKEKILETH